MRVGWGVPLSFLSACLLYVVTIQPLRTPHSPRARFWVVVVGSPPQEKSNGTVRGRCKFLVFPFR